MSEELFKVMLMGYSADKKEYFTDADFAKLFNITTEKANALLHSAPKMIKENITLEQAELYKSKVEETGVVCEIESMENEGGLTLEDY